jgi:tetratricopeptide (TPR) repeat protein
MKSKSCLFVFGLLILSVPALAQSPGTGATSSGTNAPANRATGPESTSDIGKNANWDQMVMQGRSGNAYGGRVTTPGGMLPWEPIRVVVTCDGTPRYSTYTDANGNFMIAPTNAQAPLAADVAGKPTSATAFAGCDVHAVFPGYTSSTLLIANRSFVDNPDIGTIKITPESGSADASLSATSASVPKVAKKAFEKARSEWLDKKPDRAEKDLKKAVKDAPQFAEAWYQLGKLQQAKAPQDAWNSYSKAVAADPNFILPYRHLSEMAVLQGKWQDVVNYTDKELQLNPQGSPEVWYYNAFGNYRLNKPDIAEARVRKAVAMDALHTEPKAEQLLAVLLANKQDFAGALQHLEVCIKYLPPGPEADLVKKQIAQLQSMVSQPK